MADTIVAVEDEVVAKTAYNMAQSLWFASGREKPNIETCVEFIELVSCCAYALSGRKASIIPSALLSKKTV